MAECTNEPEGCTFQRNPRATLSDRSQRVAAFPNEPNGCTNKRTRAWQNPSEPKPCAPERTRATAAVRRIRLATELHERTRAGPEPSEPEPRGGRTNPSGAAVRRTDFQRSCTIESERVKSQANPSRAPAKRARARRHPNEPTWRRVHERVEAFRNPNEPERRVQRRGHQRRGDRRAASRETLLRCALTEGRGLLELPHVT
jgi:hypothetical protein